MIKETKEYIMYKFDVAIARELASVNSCGSHDSNYKDVSVIINHESRSHPGILQADFQKSSTYAPMHNIVLVSYSIQLAMCSIAWL